VSTRTPSLSQNICVNFILVYCRKVEVDDLIRGTTSTE
jgi:hypothetical protein